MEEGSTLEVALCGDSLDHRYCSADHREGGVLDHLPDSFWSARQSRYKFGEFLQPLVVQEGLIFVLEDLAEVVLEAQEGCRCLLRSPLVCPLEVMQIDAVAECRFTVVGRLFLIHVTMIERCASMVRVTWKKCSGSDLSESTEVWPRCVHSISVWSYQRLNLS